MTKIVQPDFCSKSYHLAKLPNERQQNETEDAKSIHFRERIFETDRIMKNDCMFDLQTFENNNKNKIILYFK